MSTLSSYVNEVIALMKGDADEAIAARNERKANSAMTSQISGIDSKIVDAEEKVSDAEEALRVAIYPTSRIEDASRFLERIISAQENLDSAQDNLKELKEQLAYWKNLKSRVFNPPTAAAKQS
jgi:predicted  nucleic acid-binding Zn-ribbon protein